MMGIILDQQDCPTTDLLAARTGNYAPLADSAQQQACSFPAQQPAAAPVAPLACLNIYQEFLRNEHIPCWSEDHGPHGCGPAEVEDAVSNVQEAHEIVQARIRHHIATKTTLFRMQKVWMEMDESLNRMRSAMNQFRALCCGSAGDDGGVDDVDQFEDIETIMGRSMQQLSLRINQQSQKVKGSEDTLASIVPLINLLGNPANAEAVRYHEMYTV